MTKSDIQLLPRARAKRSADPQPGSLRDEHVRVTRERLVDAALAIFKKEGFRNATVDEITAFAQINRSTFYLHFRNKAALIRPIGVRAEPAWKAMLERLDRPEDLTLELLRAWTDDAAKFWMRNSVIIEIMQDAMASDPELAEYKGKSLRHLSNHMTNILALVGEQQRESVIQKFALLQMMQEQLFFLTIVRGHRFPSKEMLDSLADLWWMGLFRDVKAMADKR
jgi:AcrR family transcriptional regulator